MACNCATIKNVDIDISIGGMRPMRENTSASFLATFDLRYGDIVMRGWKIILGPKTGKMFIAPAARRCGNRHFEHYYVCDKTVRMMIEEMALATYAKMILGEKIDDTFPDFLEGED